MESVWTLIKYFCAVNVSRECVLTLVSRFPSFKAVFSKFCTINYFQYAHIFSIDSYFSFCKFQSHTYDNLKEVFCVRSKPLKKDLLCITFCIYLSCSLTVCTFIVLFCIDCKQTKLLPAVCVFVV